MNENETAYRKQLVIDTLKATQNYNTENAAVEIMKCFNGFTDGKSQAEIFAKIMDVVLNVESRCLAADGPVTPTLDEMTEGEMRVIWLLAVAGSKL